MKRILILLVGMFTVAICQAQRTLAPSPNFMRSSTTMRHMTAVYKSLLHEDSYRFCMLHEVWNEPQYILVCTCDNTLILRKAEKRIRGTRTHKVHSIGLPIEESFAELLSCLMEAAVNSADYQNYWAADDGGTYYYIIGNKAAIHGNPWPDFPLDNPDVNNVKVLVAIVDELCKAVIQQDFKLTEALKQDMISLTTSFNKEL